MKDNKKQPVLYFKNLSAGKRPVMTDSKGNEVPIKRVRPATTNLADKPQPMQPIYVSEEFAGKSFDELHKTDKLRDVKKKAPRILQENIQRQIWQRASHVNNDFKAI